MKLTRIERTQLRLIGSNIRKLRRAQSLTLAALADAALIPENRLKLYEKGSAVMRVEELLRLAKALRVAPDRLYT